MMRNVSKMKRCITYSNTTKKLPPRSHDVRTAHQQSAEGHVDRRGPHPNSLPTDSDRQSLPRSGDGECRAPLPASASAAGPAAGSSGSSARAGGCDGCGGVVAAAADVLRV